MPTASVQALETDRPGFIAKRLDFWWDWICAKLRKRYDVEAMSTDPPLTAQQWLVDLVTKVAYDARGYDPSAKADETAIVKAFEDAKLEIKEAADSKDGLTELPLLAADTATDGVSKGGPLGSSEQSPYVWTTRQRDAGRDEDSSC
jgi:hypothetical protein